MDREPIGAIFQRIFFCDRRAGELSVLADKEKPDAKPLGERGAEDEAARLDRGNKVRLFLNAACEMIDGGGKAWAVEKQSSDIAELDPGFRKVRDRADQRPQLGPTDTCALLRPDQPSTPRPSDAASAFTNSRRAMFSGSSGPALRTSRFAVAQICLYDR